MIMKNIASILILTFTLQYFLFALENTNADNSDNLYGHALFAGIKSMDKEWGHIKDCHDTTRVQINYKNIVLDSDPELTDSIPTSHDNVQVELLDRQGLLERSKSLNKAIPVIRLHPIKNNKSKLLISLTLYWVSYKNSLLHYALSDWCTVTFSFDCRKNKYIVMKTELGGI